MNATRNYGSPWGVFVMKLDVRKKSDVFVEVKKLLCVYLMLLHTSNVFVSDVPRSSLRELIAQFFYVKRSGPVPRAKDSQVSYRSVRGISQLNLKVYHILEVTGIATAVLLKDVATRIGSVKDCIRLFRKFPLTDVLSVEVKDGFLILGRWAVMSNKAVLLKSVGDFRNESRLSNSVRAADNDKHGFLLIMLVRM